MQISSPAYATEEIELVRDYNPTGLIFLDRHRVLQILINLLSNARHAVEKNSPGERRVCVRIFSEPNQVCWRVSDNGVGIPAESLARVFNQGFTTRPNGHGFGLHSSALAAKEMNGMLSVESSGVGKGAAFTLILPAQTALS